MPPLPGSAPIRVLIAGGGVAGIEALLAIRSLAGDRVSLELLTPEPEFTYRPRAVLEPFRLGARRRYPLAKIAREQAAVHHRDSLESVDHRAHAVRTGRGAELGYEILVVAIGARPVPALDGAITFSDQRPDDLARVLDEVREGTARRLAFVAPPGSTWPLPLYELALITSYDTVASAREKVDLTLITIEDDPLGVFGRQASATIARLLRERGIEVRTATYAESASSGDDGVELILRPGGDRVRFDRVIALPRLVGPGLEGLPADESGFVPVDHHGRVLGAEDCFAAGEMTSFPVKQGGIAAQQADAAAEMIAARAGAAVEPEEFRPVLRGVLLTSSEPEYLRAALSGGQGETSIASSHVLWWPSTKIAGRFLAPYIARLDASTAGTLEPEGPQRMPIDAELTDI